MSAWPRFSLAALLACTFALGLFGIGRSLWLDEAWVANSIAAPTLHDMFYYPDWLQTSPPLFLLLSRGAVRLIGLSNAAFRVVPLAFALIAAGSLFSLSRRVLSLPAAVLASALVVFHPAFIEYSHSAKQYSGEVAATVLTLLAVVRYLEIPSRRAFFFLVITAVIALTASYPTAFLLTGVVAALYFSHPRRAIILSGAAAATLLFLWAVLIRYNTAPELQAFWKTDADALFTPGLIGAVVLVLILTVRLLATRTSMTPRRWLQLVCAIPCLLLANASVSGWYPASQRMRLWVLPCFVLLCLLAAEDVFRNWRPQSWGRLTLVVALLFAAVNISSQIRDRRDLPEEDYASAFQTL